MEFKKQLLTVAEAKKWDLVDYLSRLGHEPQKIRAYDHWYISPFRSEKTASFKVNRKLNQWYDHGLGKGGNLVDFAILYHNCSIKDFLEKHQSFSFHQQNAFAPDSEEKPQEKIKILSEHTLSSFALLKYLHQRCIAAEIADQFCREVRYELRDKIYYGIGFKNDSGGFEIRNRYFKASSAPKDSTTINGNNSVAFVFEGFADFLSFYSLQKDSTIENADFVILNSLSFFEKSRPFMEQHDQIRLFLDRDASGQNYSRYALSLSRKYKDESLLYEHHKDLNDWVVHANNPNRLHKGNKL